jgi:PAS domain S-box-containing protein
MSTGAGGAVAPLAGLLAALADAVLIVDSQGLVAAANPQAAQLLGHDDGTLAGRPVTELLTTPASLPFDPWTPVGAPGEAPGPGVELCAHHRDGLAFSVQAIVAPATLDDGTVLVATLRGPTAGEQSAAERVAAVVRSSPDAIISIDLQGLITDWNEGAHRMYGYTAQEAIGQHATMLMAAERQGELEDVIAAAVKGDVVPQLETQRIAKSGETLTVSLSASPLRDARGAIIGAASVARDLTERALIVEELRRSNRDLEQFAYVASHDLSEPLRVIAGFVDLLARRYRGRLDEDADRFIDFIISGVERMQALIDDLLNYSRAGRAQLERRPVDVGAVVRDVLWALGPQLTAHAVDVDVSPLPVVQAEKAMLRQIFQNLISNAIKFGDADHPAIRVGATQLSSGWRFDVQDNGCGVEPRHADRIFDMFQRLHGREVPGSGMGLAIVKRLTERLGGHVSVTAAAPRGSIFSVTIPDRGRSS